MSTIHNRAAGSGTSSSLARLLFLPELSRFGDLGLLLLRCVTGAFLIYQSHDNIFSTERMQEFVKFLTQFGFFYPEIMAPWAVWWQFIAGIGFILGLFTRWLGLVTAIQFIVACWMVHWPQDFAGWWPALILVFLGLYFAARGSGRYGIDPILEERFART
jgi:putative oxidoreductase